MGNQAGNQFAKIVSDYQASNSLVGLGAIVLKNGALRGVAVSGEREVGSGVSLNINDKWHIGSITKSITATMIARLVEKKTLSWDTSIGQVFSSFDALHDDWKEVTVLDLLTHVSGARPNFPVWVHLQRPKEGPDRVAARKKAVLKLLRKRSSYQPRSVSDPATPSKLLRAKRVPCYLI